MRLHLYNTLSKQKEVFKPIKPNHVGMYNCGPTVYDYVHIGNLRSYVFADTLRRMLEWNGYEVTQVINITDVGHLASDADTGEDKMTKGLRREGLPVTLDGMRELGERYTQAFIADLHALNIKPPQVLPRASDHITEQIEIINVLEEKGFTYHTRDGVYFDTSKDPNYGRLAGMRDQTDTEARIEPNPEKRNPRDFALWKFSAKSGSASGGDVLGWDAPWGKGFPGWHIECSAMSMKYLGETFDIHTGGIDHIPIHHTNEIAQSENYSGKVFAHYWLHNAFVNLKDDPSSSGAVKKMAKSAGGFITRQTLEEKGIDPLAYRYWLLTAHYRTPVNFSWEALEGAQNALVRLKNRIMELPDGGPPDSQALTTLSTYINDDLDTPQAIAFVWDLLKDPSITDANKKATLVEFDKVLGLHLSSLSPSSIPDEVQKLVMERETARANQEWDTADHFRQEIEKRGFHVKDTDEGPVVKPHSASSTSPQ